MVQRGCHQRLRRRAAELRQNLLLPPSRSSRRCESADGVTLAASTTACHAVCAEPMLPGFMRTLSTPGRDRRRARAGSQNECPPRPAAASPAQIAPSASAACISGTAQRTISTARVRQRANLRQRRLRVARIRVGHGLHRDGGAAANQYVPNLDLLWSIFIPLPLSQMENGEWKMENECAAHSAVI